MSGRGGKKRKMDQDHLMKLKFRAKCRFRAVYRMVKANAYWLMEDVEHYEGVDDVKRRVAQAVMGKTKKKTLLTIRDKALLNKPADERTDHEKKYLYRILGGLKCFKKYPNHVKKKLAALTYFKYYDPGRVIVRQNQEGHALYFIVSGTVVVSQMIWDGLLQQFIATDIGMMQQGDMFGEVSLLHNIPRSATITTHDHCELLTLLKEDFKNVLLASVQKEWDEVHRAMSAFTYFASLDERGLREGCIVAKLKSYERNETLLGDGVGVPNCVYFIMTGRCQMIESLQVTVTKRLGKFYYTLYDPHVEKSESEQDINVKYFKNLHKNSKSASPSESTTKEANPVKGSTIAALESILNPDGSVKQDRLSVRYESVPIFPHADKRDSGSSKVSVRSQVILPPSDTERPRESVRLSLVPKVLTVNEQARTKPANLKTIFMQVVQYYPGSTFGFGENMRDRRIIALGHVECLLLPLVWLLQRNTANIWTRIKHYLEKTIPDKKALFKEFVNERLWQEYRDQIVEDIVTRANNLNFTSLHDVPYSIRMEEMMEY